MRLSLVPTPIGNLEDITLRALRVLKEAEVVACEDTRRTGILLKHFGISKPMVRLDQHTVGQARRLLQGYERVAYVTDAGTPGISDPGAELVALALREGWQLEVLPGPTALIPALVASGLPTARFAFEGFLPQKRSERRARLAQVTGRTVVLYEAPTACARPCKTCYKSTAPSTRWRWRGSFPSCTRKFGGAGWPTRWNTSKNPEVSLCWCWAPKRSLQQVSSKKQKQCSSTSKPRA